MSQPEPPAAVPPASRGRPRATSREAIAACALELFGHRGFEQTTMDDIATEMEISRKTLFNYFPNKSDIVWSDFNRELADLTQYLNEAGAEEPTLSAVSDSIIRSLRLGPGQRTVTRTQARLIDSVPALHGHAAIRGRRWADAIAAFVGSREGLDPTGLVPQLIGRCYWTAMFAGLIQWAESQDEQPETHIRAAFRLLADGPGFS